ncbi:hypothetical protein SAMN04489718_1112 [Actinopolyspora saharensis]|uniref:Uncharacterized protein n=2 Tax=Actinopolyspora saharensis TaxID=995062 RepID=A0A1H0ZKW9_9ACTN|nr:hypothetical protein [Actinopolyspora saharensis]SDQ28155.1 hypothetical protein SAMN04489718_1112 [Actinopolyspora saharensis]
MPCPSATMVVWTSAWLHGAAASDDVLDAVQTWAEVNQIRAVDDETAARLQLPGPGETPAGPALLLAAVRRAGGDTGNLVLPVAGDARGLDGATEFARDAMRRGEAAVFAEAGLALVPETVAEGILDWTVHEVSELPPREHIPVGEAEHDMSSAMREAASTLTELDISRSRPGVRAEIAEKISARPQPSWPGGVPQRCLRVLQRATEVDSILWAATADAPGGATSASADRARGDALRPLFDSVRTARCAAVDEMVRALTQSTDKQR